MTAQTKTIIKSYFETGDRPTQSNFADLVDSYQDANSTLTTLASASVGTVGLQVLSATTTAEAQNSLGGGTVGRQLFQCVTTAAAQSIIDYTIPDNSITGAKLQTGGTTSAQLRGALSDETGTGAAVFATQPTIAGMIAAAGTNSVASKVLTSGTNLTTATAGSVEYDGKVQYFTPQGTQRGVVPAEQFFTLDSALAGANVNTAQNIFGVGCTLSGSTYYEFEGMFNFSKSAGTTSHSFSLLFGGSASLNKIGYQITGDSSTVSFTSGFGTRFSVAPQVATAITAYSGLTSANLFLIFMVKGIVSVNAGGTFIPQYILSAAPGGAYSTAAGSYFKIKPIGASGANVSVGAWA